MLKHHLDANVVIGVFFFDNEKIREACKSYCAAIGHKYKGSISIVALGEVTKIFAQQSKDKATREDALSFLGDFLQRQHVLIDTITKEDVLLALELKEMNRNCDWPELISLAVAIRDKSEVFITLDGDVHNETFKNEMKKLYQIAIQRPL